MLRNRMRQRRRQLPPGARRRAAEQAAAALMRSLNKRAARSVAVYLAFKRSQRTGWTAGLTVPVALLDAQADRSMSIIAVAGLTLLLGLGGAALYYSRRKEKKKRDEFRTGGTTIAQKKKDK